MVEQTPEERLVGCSIHPRGTFIDIIYYIRGWVDRTPRMGRKGSIPFRVGNYSKPRVLKEPLADPKGDVFHFTPAAYLLIAFVIAGVV